MAIQVGGTTVIDNTRNITGTTLTVGGNLTKQILGIDVTEDATDYTRSSTTIAEFGGTYTYTKVDNDSDVHVILSMNCVLNNTGTDNDSRAEIGIGVRNSSGTYVQQTNASPNVGYLNMGANGNQIFSHITMAYVTQGSSETYSNQVWIRPYGGITTDTTSGYASELELQNTTVTFIEVSP